jgi:transposase InsO family protein
MSMYPTYPNHIWVADFTHLSFQGKEVYISTVMDLFTRRIVGLSIYTNHAVQLVLASFMNALYAHPRPDVFHSDNGSEYNAQIFVDAVHMVGTVISRSQPGCPWENGYQESFYSQFKVDFGDPGRFTSLGELVFTIYQTIYVYNHSRIHSALKMSPVQFAQKVATR